jgi:hypothetical protein
METIMFTFVDHLKFLYLITISLSLCHILIYVHFCICQSNMSINSGNKICILPIKYHVKVYLNINSFYIYGPCGVIWLIVYEPNIQAPVLAMNYEFYLQML